MRRWTRFTLFAMAVMIAAAASPAWILDAELQSIGAAYDLDYCLQCPSFGLVRHRNLDRSSGPEGQTQERLVRIKHVPGEARSLGRVIGVG